MEPIYVTDYQLFSDADLAEHAAAFAAACEAEEATAAA